MKTRKHLSSEQKATITELSASSAISTNSTSMTLASLNLNLP
jgi:hypothetical protein